MYAKGQTVIQMMEQLAPKYYAEADDKIGLQVGTLNKEIRKVLVTLEITDAVITEAIEQQVDLIIAHHAVIFRPLANIVTDFPQGQRLERLIKHDIAVYIAHTNLDIVEGGMNDWMADALQLSDAKPLKDIHTEKLYKLVVFVPIDHHERVLQAVFEAGAGWIGNYSNCSFNSEGTGTFLPQEGSEPFIGTQGKMERVNEIRVETVVPEHVRRQVIQAMLKAHPYEEVAYGLYHIDLQGRTFGLGRIGRLQQAVTLSELCEQVKSAFAVDFVRTVGSLSREVNKVAVLGGSGAKFMKSAIFAGADVYITGDIDYHTAQDALAAGICLIDPGHHAEVMMKQPVADFIRGKLQQAQYETEVLVSNVDTNPFQVL